MPGRSQGKVDGKKLVTQAIYALDWNPVASII